MLLAFEPADVEPLLALGPRAGLYILISTDSVYEAVPLADLRRSDRGVLEESAWRSDPARAAEDEYGANKLATELHLYHEASQGKERLVGEPEQGPW